MSETDADITVEEARMEKVSEDMERLQRRLSGGNGDEKPIVPPWLFSLVVILLGAAVGAGATTVLF